MFLIWRQGTRNIYKSKKSSDLIDRELTQLSRLCHVFYDNAVVQKIASLTIFLVNLTGRIDRLTGS